LFFAGLVASLLCLALSPAALASTVNRSGATIFYTAQVGEGNNLTVTVSGSNFVFAEAVDGTPVTIQDTDVGGCISFGSNTANCPTSGVTRITVALRNLNDTANLSTISIAVTLNGEDDNDTLTAGSGADTLDGGAGNDTLIGNAGSDTFASSAGNDTATGGIGDDVFAMGTAADGADAFTGDSGSDTADYSQRAAAVTLTVDNAANDGAASEGDNLRHIPSEIGTPNTIEVLKGGQAGDTITGSPCPSVIQGGGGTDTLNGAPVSGSCSTRSGSDDDVLDGGPSADILNGVGGPDILRGGSGGDTFNGGTGSDTADYSTEGGANRVISIDGVANDGGESDNVALDVEHVIGGSGNDTITGDADANTLNGGPGGDTLDGAGGNDTLTGAGDADTATYAARSSAVTADNDGVADDGGSGETDNIGTDVERIIGGTAADHLSGGAGGDGLFGGPGGDTLNGLGGNDRLQGDDGQDTLNGGDGADSISGSDNNDTLNGGSGNDTLDGNDGADTVNGGLGDDLINILPDGNNDAYFGNDGVDGVSFYRNASCFGGGPCDSLSVSLDDSANDGGGGGGDNVHSDIENVTITDLPAGFGNDSIVGDADANVLSPGRGDDTITGGIGNDTLIGGAANDTLNGGSGQDTLLGGEGVDELNGQDGNDSFEGGPGGDTYSGGTGTDTADYSARAAAILVDYDTGGGDGEAGEGDQVDPDVENVKGGSANDTILGGNLVFGSTSTIAANLFQGNGGNDVLDGRGGNDQLFGGNGDDTIRGGTGVDIMGGDFGNDTLDGQSGQDFFDGGEGTDTADYSSRTAAVNVNLSVAGGDGQAGENDDIFSSVENVVGGSVADVLTGHAEANRLVGGGGNDTLSGLGGNDAFDGGAGADVLNGGDGTDIADYSTRAAALVLDADGAADDGEAGENDRVQADVEHLKGGTGNDLFPAGSALDGPDRFTGNAGLDTIDYSSRSGGVKVHKGGGQDGESGEGDTVDFDVENVKGGSGNDQIDGSVDANLLLGGAGDDIINAGNGDDHVDGGPGGDTMSGGAGSDIVDYSARTAALTVTLGDGLANDGEAGEGDNLGPDFDVVLGGSGNDRLTGSSIQNILRGEGGHDVLDGAGANDTLVGGPGDDRMLGGAGGVNIDNDDLVGEDGVDTADYSGRVGALTIDLDDDDDDGGTGEGDNVWASTENVLGGSGNDTLTGNGSANFLRGNGGTDVLLGMGGDDRLHSRDTNAESPDCGEGTADIVETDSDDTPLASCETESERAFDPPVNASAPMVSGTPDVGQTLTGSDGTWTGFEPIEFAYQWQNGDGTTWTDIAGANASTYVVRVADSGKRLRLVVTASNEDASASESSVATAVVQPALSIGDMSVTETDTGMAEAIFTVSLSSPAPTGGVPFNYTTANGSAVAGLDYAAAGAVAAAVPQGESETTITIQVLGDTLDEVNETFTVTLAGATNATIFDGQATGTIVDNDPAPTMRVNNVRITEGNSGTKTLRFTVRLSAASGKTITVRYATANGTARASSDYKAKSGLLTFLPGRTARTVGVAVRGDLLNEANETFFLNLRSPVNATFADRVGRAIIVDND
jgi:Ca2+-binding RTX toxin-like protein